MKGNSLVGLPPVSVVIQTKKNVDLRSILQRWNFSIWSRFKKRLSSDSFFLNFFGQFWKKKKGESKKRLQVSLLVFFAIDTKIVDKFTNIVQGFHFSAEGTFATKQVRKECYPLQTPRQTHVRTKKNSCEISRYWKGVITHKKNCDFRCLHQE